MSNQAYLPLVTLTDSARQAAETGMLVAASDRLRRECRYAYDYGRMTAGQTAWKAPTITGFDALLRRDHERAARLDPHCPSLLSPVAAHDLFRRCAPNGLVHLTALFEDAWQQLHTWQLDHNSEAFADTENTRVFAYWARAVNAELTKQNLITAVQLGGQHYPQAALDGPVHLLGFDVLNPGQRRWVEIAQQSGAMVTSDPALQDRSTEDAIRTSGTTGSISCFSNPVTELTRAICWARDQLDQTLPTEPLPRIAIVVPDLLQQHASVSRLLHSQLEASGSRESVLYNLGGGLPLSAHPLVSSALRLLNSIHHASHYTELERLLVDPALPALNNAKRIPASCNEFMRLQDIPPDVCTEPLRVILRSVQGWPDASAIETEQSGSLRRTVQEWWQAAASVLRNARWHTARGDSEGYQATNALLDLLMSQAPEGDTFVAWSDAFALLSSVASQTLFAPAGQPAPVQVLGYLEAQELEFDCLWITGMSDTAWPTPVVANPLLPVAALTAAGAPRTTHSSELRFAQNWLQRVTRYPTKLRASYAEEDAALTDSAEQILTGASALLEHWQATPAPELDTSITGAAWHPALLYWQRFAESNPITLAPTEQHPEKLQGPPPEPPNLRRAIRRLQDQAACPMRGWATHQLGLQEPIKPHTLPDPIERGNVLHEALDRLYKEITSSDQLAGLSAANEKLLCQNIAHQCVDELMTRYAKPVRTLEAERLVTQLGHFLSVERKRGEFTVIALETDSKATVGTFAIDLRPDRVDDTPGGQFVIDYKSSAPSKANLLDDRLSAPQIPLYVLLQMADGKPVQNLSLTDPIVTAGAFAQLKPEDAKYVGLRAPDTDLGIKSVDGKNDWTQVLTRWRDQITLLADEVAAGVADAKPTKVACASCSLQSFCRYHLRDE